MKGSNHTEQPKEKTKGALDIRVLKEAGEFTVIEACGVKLEKEHLVNAIIALCPRNWDIIEDHLVAFGEHAYQKVMGPAS